MGAAPAAPPLTATQLDSAGRAVRAGVLDALAAGRLVIPPLTPTERDSLARAAAAEVAGWRRGGGPPAMRGGVSVPGGLPGGGPSRRRRERDRAVNAATLEIVARMQRRADSAVAARAARRAADSLARVAGDSAGVRAPR